MKRVAICLLWMLLVAACGQGEDEPAASVPAGPPECSADTLQPELTPPEGLPAAVSDIRRAILEAAADCDYERLEALALEGGTAFVNGSRDSLPPPPAAYWRELEARGEQPLALLVRTLELPYALEHYQVEPRAVYLWPSAYRDGATGFDVFALKGLYSDEQIARFIAQGSYTGSRVGITEDGDWWFFLPGDQPDPESGD